MNHRTTGRIVAAGMTAAALVASPGGPRVATGQAAPGAGAGRPVPELFEPGRVSTGAHELAIRFNPQMDEMYVMRSGPDWHTGILRYRREAEGWSKPVLVAVQQGGGVAYPFIAPDGRRLFFELRLPAPPGPGAPATSDVWVAQREGDGWGAPSPLGPAVNSPAAEMHPSVAANGNLYFGSNRPGGLGGFDIYRAVAGPGGYDPAENLGPAVNSVENEYHPFIAPDESYLLYDARRTSGAGANDLYISVKGADGRFGPAVPLADINTPAAEMRPYVTPDGRRLFFCSDRSIGRPEEPSPSFEAFERRINGPGNGSQDLYWVTAGAVTRRLPGGGA